MGLSDDKKMNRSQAIVLNGTNLFDRGKFVDVNKCIVDRYFGNTAHAASQVMFDFSPGSFTIRFKWRGEGMNWPKEWSQAMSFKKIDEYVNDET
jgi:hypothetical protein